MMTSAFTVPFSKMCRKMNCLSYTPKLCAMQVTPLLSSPNTQAQKLVKVSSLSKINPLPPGNGLQAGQYSSDPYNNHRLFALRKSWLYVHPFLEIIRNHRRWIWVMSALISVLLPRLRSSVDSCTDISVDSTDVQVPRSLCRIYISSVQGMHVFSCFQ